MSKANTVVVLDFETTGLSPAYGDQNLVAHNASFDKRFLDSELRRVSKQYTGTFACSMLLSRRLYQDATNHKLATLVRYAKIPSDGNFHRALYDSEMTAKLWLAMLEHINSHYGLSSIPFALTQKLAKTAKHNVSKLLNRKIDRISPDLSQIG